MFFKDMPLFASSLKARIKNRSDFSQHLKHLHLCFDDLSKAWRVLPRKYLNIDIMCAM